MAHFVISIRHYPSDSFASNANCVLDIFTALRRTAWFRSNMYDYAYGVHCRYQDSGPNPHVHVYCAVTPHGVPDDVAADQLGIGAFQQLRPIVRSLTKKHLLEEREPGRVVVKFIPLDGICEACSKLASYAVKAVYRDKHKLPFGRLSELQKLELFHWLRGTKSRRLIGGGTNSRNRVHGP